MNEFFYQLFISASITDNYYRQIAFFSKNHQRLTNIQQIFSFDDRADIQEELVGQIVFLFDASFFFIAYVSCKRFITALITHINFILIYSIKLNDIIFCLVTDRNNSVSIFTGILK